MATTPADLTDGTVAISESDNAVDGKYLLIKVPEFAKDIAGDPAGDAKTDQYDRLMTSFLRLGAAPVTEAERKAEPGYDLIQYAYEAGAGPVGFTGELELEGGKTARVAFIDDERNRGAGDVEPLEAQGHGMTPEQRYKWHTRHLQTRGGWRDHSDGNRISTTYGDKLEVIRGNYKLIVMGRQDDVGNAQGHEWSGNHVQDWGQGTMPGASVTLEWIQNGYVPGAPILKSKEDPADKDEFYLGGAWLLINSTERVYQYSRNAGNFSTQQWGDKLEAYVGSEDPERIGTTPEVGYKGQPTRPEIAAFHKVLDGDDLVDKLRPDSVGLPRGNPHIIEKTWAESIDSATGSEAWRIPQIHETTWAVSMTDSTTADTITTTTKVKTMKETTTAGSIVSTTYAGAIVDTTIAGMVVESTIAPLIESFLGIRLSIDLSAAIEINTGYKAEFILNFTNFFTPVKDEIVPLKNEITGIRTEMATTANLIASTCDDVVGMSNLVAITRNELAKTSTELAQEKLLIDNLFMLMANAVMIG